MKAAILIQKWYRRYVARLEMRRQYTWNIFQHIEYSGEQNQLKVQNFFKDILSFTEGGNPKLKQMLSVEDSPTHGDSLIVNKEDAELNKKINYNKICIEPEYTGPHIRFPLTSSNLKSLIQGFKVKQLLHAKYVLEILNKTRNRLKNMENINRASTSIAKQITVCGDIHGNISDLFMIFHKNGLPSEDNPYIFNGDFVDRGSNSVEVVLILFVSFLIFPNEVYLNRGNHEDHMMNLRYGFVKEIMKKYKEHAPRIMKMFEDVFSWLPLATVVDQKILVVHGGISNDLDLISLNKIDRHKYVSTLRPPSITGIESVDLEQCDPDEWKQVLDVLWSDPKPTNGCLPNSFRGGGSYFGPDVTESFLKKHKLKLIIRSHECKQEGYEYNHGGKILTIFSASNYYELGSNRGAYVKFQYPDLRCHLVQFDAAQKLINRKITFTQRIGLVESSAIQDLKERILATKSEILREIRKYDSDNTGSVHLNDWCAAMESVLDMNLPWRTLRAKLVKCDLHGYVLYNSIFDESKIKHRFGGRGSGNGPTVTEILYRHRDSLETVFRLMDKDNSGCVSMDEFRDTCDTLTKHLNMGVPPEELDDLAKSMDFNKDGVINFNEFLEAFRIVDLKGNETYGRALPNISPVRSLVGDGMSDYCSDDDISHIR